MKKFVVEMDVEVADHDEDIIDPFPEAILGRFRGTAIHVTNIRVIKDDRS